MAIQKKCTRFAVSVQRLLPVSLPTVGACPCQIARFPCIIADGPIPNSTLSVNDVIPSSPLRKASNHARCLHAFQAKVANKLECTFKNPALCTGDDHAKGQELSLRPQHVKVPRHGHTMTRHAMTFHAMP